MGERVIDVNTDGMASGGNALAEVASEFDAAARTFDAGRQLPKEAVGGTRAAGTFYWQWLAFAENAAARLSESEAEVRDAADAMQPAAQGFVDADEHVIAPFGQVESLSTDTTTTARGIV